MTLKYLSSFLLLVLISFFACEDPPVSVGTLQLSSARVGGVSILGSNQVDKNDEIILTFSSAINSSSLMNSIILTQDDIEVSAEYKTSDLDKIITLTLDNELEAGKTYVLNITSSLIGQDGETFNGIVIEFTVSQDKLLIVDFTYEGSTLEKSGNNTGISQLPTFELELNAELTSENILNYVTILGVSQPVDFDVEQTSPTTFKIIVTEELDALSRYNIFFASGLGDPIDRDFVTVIYQVFTDVPTEPVFPLIDDDALMTLIQEQTFKYFWDFGHPVSGMARERNTSNDVVTTGGTGFGLMAMIVAVERGFITRQQAVDRWIKVTDFLENADRFHGAWSHWLNGNTGSVVPFSPNDNGGDIVETAFLVQGLLTVRQYLDQNNAEELALAEKITELWEAVEWNWYQKGGENQLYWHWSPNFEWAINLRVSGHNETQIIYTLAAASPTFGIEKEVYTNGYARNGAFQNGNSFYGINLPLGGGFGGPLFFSHYSYLGMDPRNLQDEYSNYWTQNINHSLINRAHCIENPGDFVGYSDVCWGLTASDNNEGYSAHSPTNDRGVITPTAALSSIVYTPEESMDAMRHFYFFLGDRLWGEYGFYDAFNPTQSWVASSFLAIDQGPIICMIENHRTQLLWDLYMSAPEVTAGLDKLGFTY